MSIRHCVAVDLGASSGRVMLASYQPGPRALTLREIHRFTNSLQKVDGFDCWDVDSLEGEIRRGLEKVCEQGILIDSIGIARLQQILLLCLLLEGQGKLYHSSHLPAQALS